MTPEISVSASTERFYDENAYRRSINACAPWDTSLGLEDEEIRSPCASALVYALRPAPPRELPENVISGADGTTLVWHELSTRCGSNVDDDCEDPSLVFNEVHDRENGTAEVRVLPGAKWTRDIEGRSLHHATALARGGLIECR